MTREEHYRRLERMYEAAPINAFFEPELRISKGRAEIRVKVRPDLFHAAGAVHGSVYFKSLDDAAFFAVNSLVPDVFVLTITFHVHLLRPISEGEMTATGQVVHGNRRLYVSESELKDSRDRLIARGSGTFMPSNIPLSEKLGYV
jgi:uncharacterized protein (TIGR00369 family)